MNSHTCPPTNTDGSFCITDKCISFLEECIKADPSTKRLHTNGNGVYTKQRKQLHERIVKEFAQPKPCIDKGQPVAVFTGGAPGSGKSTFLKKFAPYLTSDNLVKVDIDEMRGFLPEYKGWNANSTQAEVKDIYNKVIDRIGADCNFDIVVDGTMNKADKYYSLIDKVRDLGYQVFIIYIDVPKEVSEQRVRGRYQRSGRYVPQFVIDEIFEKGQAPFRELIQYADGYIAVDGQSMEIIEEGGKPIPTNRDYANLATRTNPDVIERELTQNTISTNDLIAYPRSLTSFKIIAQNNIGKKWSYTVSVEKPNNLNNHYVSQKPISLILKEVTNENIVFDDNQDVEITQPKSWNFNKNVATYTENKYSSKILHHFTIPIDQLDVIERRSASILPKVNTISETEFTDEEIISTLKPEIVKVYNLYLEKLPKLSKEQLLKLTPIIQTWIDIFELPALPSNSIKLKSVKVEEIQVGTDYRLDINNPIKLTKTERKRYNKLALDIIQKQYNEITADDIATLTKYTGAGGLEYASKSKYAGGLLNEHYTAYNVIESIWAKLQAMGIKEGNFLEPGAGIGNFTGLKPEAINMVMIEKSPISSAITKILYPNQRTVASNFNTVDLSHYNLTGAIGNVPFGDYHITPASSKFYSLKPPIHDYLILESLAALQPGGVLAMITSVGTMDKKNTAIREQMCKEAHFLGAIRMPSGTFKDNANTLVTTDVLFFQKYAKGQEPFLDEDFINTVEVTQQLPQGAKTGSHSAYYAKYPEMALGKLILGHGQQFWSQFGVKGTFSKKAFLAAPIKPLPYKYPNKKQSLNKSDKGVFLRIKNDDLPSNSIVFYENEFYAKEVVTYKPIIIAASQKERIISAINVLDAYKVFVNELATNSSDVDRTRVSFKSVMDSHIEKFGLPDEDDIIRKIFKYDTRLYKLTSFVKRNPDTKALKYADIFTANTLYNTNYVGSLSSDEDLAEITAYLQSIGSDLSEEDYLSLYKSGTATLEEIRDQFTKDDNFFLNPETQTYQYKYIYVSGNIAQKLEKANEAGLDKNIAALKKALPKPVSIFDIEISARHIYSWLPTEAIKRFLINALAYTDAEVHLFVDDQSNGSRIFDTKLYEYSYRSGNRLAQSATEQDMSLGWAGEPFSAILHRYINGKKFKLLAYNEQRELTPGVNPNKLYRQDLIDISIEMETINTNKMLSIDQTLTRWIRVEADTELREFVENEYNKIYNSTVFPNYDGSTFRVKGMSNVFYGVENFPVYQHNLSIAEKMLWMGSGGNCHDVGAGKTLASILTAMAGKQQGRWKKPLFVVPGKVIEKWIEEFQMLFPNAKNLAIRGEKADLQEELAMAQLYDWDAVFITHTSFTRLLISPPVKKKLIDDRVNEITEAISDVKSEMGEGSTDPISKRILKLLEAQREMLETEMLNLSARQFDNDVYYDQLGVDTIFVDEAHEFKNALGSKEALKLGIAKKSSQRAEDMLQKCRWLHQQRDGKGVYILTATPVVNSPVEVWHMMNLAAPKQLKEMKIGHLDNFVNLYVRSELIIAKKVNSQYVEREQVTGYINVPEMRNLISQYMDIKSYDQLQQWYLDNPTYTKDGKLVQPFKRPDSSIESVTLKPSRIHELLFEDIKLRAADIQDCLEESGCRPLDNYLLLTGNGSQIATDLRLFDEGYEGFDDNSLKVKALAQKVSLIHKEGQGTAKPKADRQNPSCGTSGIRLNAANDIYGDFFSSDVRQNSAKDDKLKVNQIIFTDFKSLKSGRSYHALIRDELVESGIPAHEIAIINADVVGVKKTINGVVDIKSKAGFAKEEQKKEAQDLFNAQQYRIIIGNKTIAEGMNLNKWTRAIHHLDIPYTPAMLQQRNGRGVRQGNKLSHVELYYYLMEDSFDQYRLALVQKKQNWIEQLVGGTGTDRTAGEKETDGSLSYEQMIAATTSDPRVQQYFDAAINAKNLGNINETNKKELLSLESSLSSSKGDVQRASEVNKVRYDLDTKLLAYLKSNDSNYFDAINEADITIRLENAGDAYDSSGNDRSLTYFQNFDIKVNWEAKHFELSDREIVLKFRVRHHKNKAFDILGRDILQPKFDDVVHNELLRQDLVKSTIVAKSNNIYGLITPLATELDLEEQIQSQIKNIIIRNTSEDEKGKAKVNSTLVFDEKRKALQISRYGSFTWKEALKAPIFEFVKALEQSYAEMTQARLDTIDDYVKAKVTQQAALTDRLQTLQQKIEVDIADEKKAYETQLALKDIINELIKPEFNSRGLLYEAINDELINYGINKLVPIYTVLSKEEREAIKAVKKAEKLRQNPSDCKPCEGLVHLGIVTEFNASKAIYYSTKNMHMLSSASGDTLYLVPQEQVKMVYNKLPEQGKLASFFAKFHNYEASKKDYEVDIPLNGEKESLGSAQNIYYASDKIIEQGDAKGSTNYYVHDFDIGRRRTHLLTDGDEWAIIVENIKIDERGILN